MLILPGFGMTCCRLCLQKQPLFYRSFCRRTTSNLTRKYSRLQQNNLLLGTTQLNYTKTYMCALSRSLTSFANINIKHKFKVNQYCLYIHEQFSTSNFLQSTNSGSSNHDKGKAPESNKLEDIRESVLTVPNLLTTSRIIATPFLGYLVLQQIYPLAFGLFVVAGITDLLDGYIARNYNQKSVFGSALDPLADKFLVTVLTVTLTMVNLVPVPLAVVIVGRDIFLIAVGFYLRYISLPPPITLSRYFDVTNATVTVHPSLISKINTFLQLTLLAGSLAAPVFGFVDHWALQCLWVLTGMTTVASGVGYVINRNKSVQFLQEKMKRKL